MPKNPDETTKKISKSRASFAKSFGGKIDPAKFEKNTENDHKTLSVDRIFTESQVRKDFNNGGLEELAESIKSEGLLQSIIVMPEGERFRVIVGERRFKAIKDVLKWSTIDCKVVNRIRKDKIPFLQLIENIIRKDLTVKEEVLAYSEIKESSKMTNREIAKNIGVSEQRVSKALSIANLIAENPGIEDLPFENLYEISKSKNPEKVVEKVTAKTEEKGEKPTVKDLRKITKGKKPTPKPELLFKGQGEFISKHIKCKLDFKTKGLRKEENELLKKQSTEMEKIIGKLVGLSKNSIGQEVGRKINISITISK